MKTQHSNISSSLDQDFAKCLEHFDHFESLNDELETISRASACLWAQGVEHAAVLQVALQFCDDIVTRPANFAPPFKDANTETVTDHQSEIIMYITGAVLHKLKSGMLALIEVMIWMSSRASSATKKRKKKARDHHSLRSSQGELGLLTPVEVLEPLMRIAYQKSKTGLKSAGLFSAEVMATGLPEESPISDLDDRVMNDIMRLFRKIMCHHEYFLFLEK
ncbi:hypothetical protein CAPTEDRAFT_205297 [Capitella teleta]|uniref:Uncharacterized protein n=1 Tax=Capitella teleta TaxID=283909 RepID=R7UUI8_CAPTE|nr:hypothetical protein CAPTEDRAFT_205297 [Capitella teleta]|eukprot:ELU07562.1 hypothetical protein CAPTEDRAFT_205297 [Capitella teleta]